MIYALSRRLNAPPHWPILFTAVKYDNSSPLSIITQSGDRNENCNLPLCAEVGHLNIKSIRVASMLTLNNLLLINCISMALRIAASKVCFGSFSRRGSYISCKYSSCTTLAPGRIKNVIWSNFHDCMMTCRADTHAVYTYIRIYCISVYAYCTYAYAHLSPCRYAHNGVTRMWEHVYMDKIS